MENNENNNAAATETKESEKAPEAAPAAETKPAGNTAAKAGGLPFKILIGGVVFTGLYTLFAWLIKSMIEWGADRCLGGLFLDWGDSVWNGFVWNFQILTALCLLAVGLVVLLAATALGASIDDDNKALNIVQHSVNMVLAVFLATVAGCIGVDLYDCMRVFWWEGFWRTINSIFFFFAMVGSFATALGVVAIYGFSLFKKLKK